MPVSRAIRRLLQVRDLEEEFSRMALELAAAELRRLEVALDASAERERQGRRLIVQSARSGVIDDRIAGIEEARWTARQAEALDSRIADAEIEIAGLRSAFLAKRVERRQAETLIQETEAMDAIQAGRRGQQFLDDWHSTHQRSEAARSASQVGSTE